MTSAPTIPSGQEERREFFRDLWCRESGADAYFVVRTLRRTRVREWQFPYFAKEGLVLRDPTEASCPVRLIEPDHYLDEYKRAKPPPRRFYLDRLVYVTRRRSFALVSLENLRWKAIQWEGAHLDSGLFPTAYTRLDPEEFQLITAACERREMIFGEPMLGWHDRQDSRTKPLQELLPIG